MQQEVKLELCMAGPQESSREAVFSRVSQRIITPDEFWKCRQMHSGAQLRSEPALFFQPSRSWFLSCLLRLGAT